MYFEKGGWGMGNAKGAIPMTGCEWRDQPIQSEGGMEIPKAEFSEGDEVVCFLQLPILLLA